MVVVMPYYTHHTHIHTHTYTHIHTHTHTTLNPDTAVTEESVLRLSGTTWSELVCIKWVVHALS